MITLDEVEKSITDFENRFNCHFEKGRRYSLFPLNGEFGWPETYPFVANPGYIYFLTEQET